MDLNQINSKVWRQESPISELTTEKFWELITEGDDLPFPFSRILCRKLKRGKGTSVGNSAHRRWQRKMALACMKCRRLFCTQSTSIASMAASEPIQRENGRNKGKKRGFWFRFKMKWNENTKLVRHVLCLRFQNRSRDVVVGHSHIVNLKCSVAVADRKTKRKWYTKKIKIKIK